MAHMTVEKKESRIVAAAALGCAALFAAPAFTSPSVCKSSAGIRGIAGDVARSSSAAYSAAAPTVASGGSAAAAVLMGGVAAALAVDRRRVGYGKTSTHRRRAVAVARAAGKLESVGIIGSSGAVGKEMLSCLENRDFPTEKVRLFAKRSAGTVVSSEKFGEITVEPFTVEAAQECDIVLMAVSGGFSQEYSPQIRGGPKGTVVIDNSSAFRYDDDIPLLVPEINGDAGKSAELIANPNCTTAIGAMALWPLHQKYKLKKVLMSTYQAASGAGAQGMDELVAGVKSFAADGTVPKPEVFAHQLPFNVIPQIDAFQENGYTKEEMKVTWELKKIFGLPEDVKVSCTAVRVPTLRAHSETIVVETEEKIDPAEARELLSKSEGVKVVDEPSSLSYPMPLNATGNYDVEVGRIRQSLIFGDHGLEFFVSGDQLLRGAALNAVIIGEQVAKAKLA